MKTLIRYASAATIFVFLDLAWLSTTASLYLNQLGYLAQVVDNKIVFNLPVGILAQVIIGLGLHMVISLSMKKSQKVSTTAWYGALIGFVIYACYDLTNFSFVRGWPLMITIIDITWGTTQGLLAGLYGYWLHQKVRS